MLFTMEDMYLHTKFLTDMLGQVLGTVDAAVLAAGAADNNCGFRAYWIFPRVCGERFLGSPIYNIIRLRQCDIIHQPAKDR